MVGIVSLGAQLRAAAGRGCPWMRVALGELGQHELRGWRRNNPRILGYLRAVGLGSWDETPWCSAFANWCMVRAGVPGTGRAKARSWLAWGRPLPIGGPRFGCVTVLRRGTNPAWGHVGFWVAAGAGKVLLLGGNQNDSVCLKRYPLERVLGFRWPLVGLEVTPWA